MGKRYSFQRTVNTQFMFQSRLIVPEKGGNYGKSQFNVNNVIFDFIHSKK